MAVAHTPFASEPFVEPENIVHTAQVADPRKAATAFSAMLAADKGVPNRLKSHRCGTVFYVVADDGKAVRFTRSM